MQGDLTEDGIREYAKNNKDTLEEILRHSNDAFARSIAWTILDRGLEDPEIEQLQREFEFLKEQRGMQ
jgi:hypothetical protein